MEPEIRYVGGDVNFPVRVFGFREWRPILFMGRAANLIPSNLTEASVIPATSVDAGFLASGCVVRGLQLQLEPDHLVRA